MPENSPPPREEPPPPAADAAGTAATQPSRDQYGPDVGCMVVLGLMLLMLPTMVFGMALFVAALVLAGIIAWLLEHLSPRQWRTGGRGWKLWLVYFLAVVLLIVAILTLLGVRLSGRFDEIIPG
jgi:ABC-type amino acid transport system permease subunit